MKTVIRSTHTRYKRGRKPTKIELEEKLVKNKTQSTSVVSRPFNSERRHG